MIQQSMYFSKEHEDINLKKTYIQWNTTQSQNEILLFAATWVDMEGIMLSEISQRKTNTV